MKRRCFGCGHLLLLLQSGVPLHLAHVQFYAYGQEGERGFSSAAPRLAEAVNGQGVYGLGLALSNVGDGNTQVDVLQAMGGRIADDAGKKVVIKSEETRTYLRIVYDNYIHYVRLYRQN